MLLSFGFVHVLALWCCWGSPSWKGLVSPFYCAEESNGMEPLWTFQFPVSNFLGNLFGIWYVLGIKIYHELHLSLNRFAIFQESKFEKCYICPATLFVLRRAY